MTSSLASRAPAATPTPSPRAHRARPRVASLPRAAAAAVRVPRFPSSRRRGSSRRDRRAVVLVPRASNDDGDGAAPKEELDFVTRMVMNVFGKDVLDDPAPAGLKRMTKEDWPDQWPALCDQGVVAAILPTDDTDELKLARAVLKQTQLETLPLGCAFDADVHGWRSAAFHLQLDGQGAAVLVAVAEDGTVFGAYNPKGWLGYGEWLDAISAFLFVYPRVGPLGLGGSGGTPVKLGKVGGSGMAIIDEMNASPKWGPDGLAFNIDQRVARSRLGTYYDTMPNGSKSLFGGGVSKGGGTVGLKSLRVYVGLGESDLARDYEPNMFQWKKGELEEVRKNDPKPTGSVDEGDGGGRGGGGTGGMFGGIKMPWDK